MNCRYEAVDQQVAGVNERMSQPNQTEEPVWCEEESEKDGPPAARRTNLNSAYQNLKDETHTNSSPGLTEPHRTRGHRSVTTCS